MRALRIDKDDEPEFVRRWRLSEEAPCCLCGNATDQGILTDDGITAGYGSRYDTHSLIWLGGRPRDPAAEPEGPVCDACIDRLVAERRVETYWSSMGGRAPALSPECVEAAFRLGVARMERTLARHDGEDSALSAFGEILHLVAGHQDIRADHPDPERAGNLLVLAVRAARGRAATEGEIIEGLAAFARRASWKHDHDAAADWLVDVLDRQQQDTLATKD